MFGRIDWDDRIMSVLFVVSSGVTAGLLTAPGIAGYHLSDTIFVIGAGTGPGAAAISLAKLISLGTLVGAIASNRQDFSQLTGIETWVSITTIGLVVAPPFAPLLESFIGSNPIIGGLTVVLQAGGYYTISYLG